MKTYCIITGEGVSVPPISFVSFIADPESVGNAVGFPAVGTVDDTVGTVDGLWVICLCPSVGVPVVILVQSMQNGAIVGSRVAVGLY